MPWARLDDAMLSHQKFEGISYRALGFWLHGLLFAARNLTDGHIPRAFVKNKTQLGLASELVRRNLWDKTEGGWTIHGYLDWQDSKFAIEARRRAGRERLARWRDEHVTRSKPVGNGNSTIPIPSIPNQSLSTSEAHEEFRKAAKDLADKLTMPNAGFVHPERTS